jgi:hypothetical protein
MLRFIVTAILILLALRFVSLIARLITAGKRPGPRLRDQRRDSERQPRPSGPRVERSDAVDVPFTEIPPDAPP